MEEKLKGWGKNKKGVGGIEKLKEMGTEGHGKEAMEREENGKRKIGGEGFSTASSFY